MAGDLPRAPVAAGSPRSGDATLLDGLFPPAVRAVTAHVGDGWDSPFREEWEAVAGAGRPRRDEFLCGRACAHAALGALGLDGPPIAVGDQREPLWPAGVVGSISHAGPLVAAVVARAADAWGLGLDIERLEPPLDSKLQDLLLTRGELSQVQRLEALEGNAAKILFSAKECVYKCVFPRTRWRLEPRQMDVSLDPELCRYRAMIEGPRGGELPVAKLEGKYRLVDGYVITALHVSAGRA